MWQTKKQHTVKPDNTKYYLVIPLIVPHYWQLLNKQP